ncbi:MAG: S8 family serine peptidase [Bacteroidetes bacterium]|nr:S8 family serine peptidase [Bacteroidota bacterium]
MRFSTLSKLVVAFFLFASFSGPGDGWKEKVDPVLLGKSGESQIEFMVMLHQQADLSAAKNLKTKAEKGQFVFEQLQKTARQTQPELWTILEGEGADYHSFYIVNAILVRGSGDLIPVLAQHDKVAWITDNPIYRQATYFKEAPDLTRGPTSVEWGLSMINADDVWALGYTGQGVVVGGQDTGYDWTHPALQPKYRGYNDGDVDHNYNWHDAIHEINPLHGDIDPSDPNNNPCGLDVTIPCDDSSHGTHTMGTMVGLDGDNMVGVAPDAEWIGARNMERGYGTPATYIECFEWFLAPTDIAGENPDPTKAPHVIANSWSCPELEGCNPGNFPVMQTAVDNLKASGVVVVVSAGNSGSGCSSVSTPSAIFENSFTIGATAQNDTIAGFSSRGPVTVDGSGRLKPNVSAPGVGVRSTIPGGGYASFSGTSMAGPHVAGVVALIISANPELAGDVEAIETILEETAIPKTTDQECGGVAGSEVPNNTYGYGRIDALAAVMKALELSGVVQPEDPSKYIEFYPNPFNNELHLAFSFYFGEADVEILDASGRLVYQTQWVVNGLRDEVLNLPQLASGVYFYRIRIGEELITGKVVRQ